MKHDRLHGRFETSGRACDAPGCAEAGEFRAPGNRSGSFDGPGDYRWFCLDHVRAFNAGYDWFEGMSAEEILFAQSPVYGWERQSRAFRPDAGVQGGVDEAPRWGEHGDPLDAIGARARARKTAGRSDGRAITAEERCALDTLGLPLNSDRRALRRRYSDLVRRYHPDRNGGDRGHEPKLQAAVEAYNLLKGSRIFA